MEVLLLSEVMLGCTTCDPAVQAGIFNEAFWSYLAKILLPVPLVGLLVIGLYRIR